MLSVTSSLVNTENIGLFLPVSISGNKTCHNELFYSKSISEYVYCISFCMLHCMSYYISILSWHFTLNVKISLILGEGENSCS